MYPLVTTLPSWKDMLEGIYDRGDGPTAKAAATKRMGGLPGSRDAHNFAVVRGAEQFHFQRRAAVACPNACG